MFVVQKQLSISSF